MPAADGPTTLEEEPHVPSNSQQSPFQVMRSLHRDVGYLTAGLTVIFALSGIAQIFRDTDLFQVQKQEQVQLQPGLAADALGPALRMREVKVDRTESGVMYFRGGSYDPATGTAVRTQKSFAPPLDRLTALHKAPSKSALHWLTLVYGVMLLFLGTSSFFMFRPGHALQKRGLVFAGIGLAVALAVLFFGAGGGA